MSPSKSSSAWYQRHIHDAYVKQANQKGYRSRSAYKLLEIQKKDHFLKPGIQVVDLGSAPGGWSQVVSECLKGKGRIYALDRLTMDPIPSVQFLQGDFLEETFVIHFLQMLNAYKIDVVLSDLAPNLTGDADRDQPAIYELSTNALQFATRVLKEQGLFLIKVFHGSRYPLFLKTMQTYFSKVHVRKPNASRDESSEVYLLGKGYKGNPNTVP